MDVRPREERDFTDFYDNLDETTPLVVFVKPAGASQGSSPLCLGGPQRGASHASTSKLYTLNTTLRDYKNTHKPQSKVPNSSKVTKALTAYGYRPATRPKRKASQCYTRFQQVYSSQLLLKYDMDEQDLLYLDWLNLSGSGVKISPEVFEITMSALEYEWHKLETRMLSVVGSGHDGRDDLKMDANFGKYGSDDGTGGVDSISEQRCAVCNDLECDNTNSIVFCDGCNIAVHQECYGVAFIPEGQWFCRRCMVNRGSSVTCAFCPSKTGAFKQLDNGMWSHVVCALWIREVYFANPVYLEPIEGVASIPRSRWTLLCYICKQKTGACVQCVARKCTQAYHVTCAKRADLHMVMEKGVLGAVASNDTLKSYCDRHSPSHVDKDIARCGIQKTRMFYKDFHSLNRKNDRLASERRKANRVNRFKWKTENGTPIAPQLFVDVVVQTLKSLKVGEDGSERMLRGLSGIVPHAGKTKQEDYLLVGGALCRYWCLKREAKKGAPLLRILAADRELSVHESTSRENHGEQESASQILDESGDTNTHATEIIEFGHRLNKDLKKLIELNSLALERQKLVSAQNAETFKMANIAYFAFQTTSREIMHRISRLLPGDNRKEDSESCNLAWKDIASGIEDGKLWSTRDVDQNVQQLLGTRGYHPVARTTAKPLRYWSETGMHELEAVEKLQKECIPFTVIEGLEMDLKQHDPKAVLESEDLSEVEEDPFTESSNREIFRKFIAQ